MTKRKPASSNRPPGEVFVSYAHADKERVRPIVDCLESAGLNVWWDEDIVPGSEWSNVLQEKLWNAACVIPVWSHNSVDSMFVRAEARTALNRDSLEHSSEFGTLLGVKIDEVSRLPLPFGELQHTDLTEWTGESCRALRPLISAARTLARRAEAPDHAGTLATKSGVTWKKSAAAELRRVTKRIGSLKELSRADTDATRDLRGALAEVHKTYEAVIEAIEVFVAPALGGAEIDGAPYAKMERGSLKKLIRDGRGHCHLIANHYGRRGGLRDWIKDHASAATLSKADRAFGHLSTADGDLFATLAEIGAMLTNESRAIVNLLLTKQQAAARKRIMRGRRRLEPLEKELDRGMHALQELQQRLGLQRSTTSKRRS